MAKKARSSKGGRKSGARKGGKKRRASKRRASKRVGKSTLSAARQRKLAAKALKGVSEALASGKKTKRPSKSAIKKGTVPLKILVRRAEKLNRIVQVRLANPQIYGRP
jgi:hypothetical protein